MKFQTKEEVKAAALESDEAALLCSIEHYNQMLAASEKELREAWRTCQVGIRSGFCAICKRHVKIGSCPMKRLCGGNCFDEWDYFRDIRYEKSWPEIRAAMGEVRRVLQEKYDELYPKKKLTETEEKFGEDFQSTSLYMDKLCKECGIRYGDHCGAKCPKKKEKPKFEPIVVHRGCFVVSVSGDNVIVKTGHDFNGICCYQYPREVDKFINALQKAKSFVEASK